MATRNATLRPAGRTADVDDAILDAVRRCVLTYGVRRTTLSEVAREAGVSRPTVYRRSPDVAALVADLVTREVRALLPASIGAGGRAGTVAAVVATAAAVRGSELFRRILDTDPELLVTYTSQRLGRSQHAVLAVLAAALAAGQADGSVRGGEPDRLAAVVLLAAQAAVVSARLVADVLPPDALDAELHRVLDSYLAP